MQMFEVGLNRNQKAYHNFQFGTSLFFLEKKQHNILEEFCII